MKFKIYQVNIFVENAKLIVYQKRNESHQTRYIILSASDQNTRITQTQTVKFK